MNPRGKGNAHSAATNRFLRVSSGLSAHCESCASPEIFMKIVSETGIVSITTAVDPAFAENEKSPETIIMTMRIDPGLFIFIVDYFASLKRLATSFQFTTFQNAAI